MHDPKMSAFLLRYEAFTLLISVEKVSETWMLLPQAAGEHKIFL